MNKRIGIGFVVTCVAMIVVGAARAQSTAPATQRAGPQRWEERVAAFERRDREAPPPKDAVLFVGSSSIVGWKLDESFPDLPTINRGFGGSQASEALYFVDRLVTPHRPRVVVFYAGENDIAAGEAPRRVADDFRAFVSKVRAARPDTKIVFIGLKPSPSRWKMIGQFREANALVCAFCESQENIVFVDVERAMLDADGQPREELFLKDMLHMNRAGYEIWTGLVRPHLAGAAAAPSTRPAG